MTADLEDLIALLARDGATVPFSGIFSEHTHDGVRRWAAHRNGHLARIEEPPGTLSMVAGHRTYWVRWPVETGFVAIPRAQGDEDYDFGMLTSGRDPEHYWRKWLIQDRELVESTLAPTTYEGRPAWQFTAPLVKGGQPMVIVDDELGMVVEAKRTDIGIFRSWTNLRTGQTPDDELFRYDGPWERADHRDYPEGWLPE